jgi:hypothetical protein
MRLSERRGLKNRTSNIERPTSNIEWEKMKKQKFDLEESLEFHLIQNKCWNFVLFDVERSMFDVGRSSFKPEDGA